MTDFRLAVCNGIIDLVILNGDLELDQGLESAILASLYSDSRAPEGVEIPDGSTDPRGWWAVDLDDEYGSELWILERSKLDTETIALAEEAATRALSWLIEDGIAADLTVVATREGDAISLSVEIIS